MKKFFITLFVVIPLLIIALLVALYFSRNWIIRNGVETFGPLATGTDVKLKEVHFSPLSGQGELKGIIIGNPGGYQSENVFELKRIRVAVQVPSIFSDRIIIDEIQVNSPEVTYEMDDKSNNIKTILNNIKSFAAKSQGKTGREASSEEKKEGETKIQVNKFIVKNGTVKMAMPALQGKGVSLPLPDILLRDIGSGEEGKNASEVLDEIFNVLNNNIDGVAIGYLKRTGGRVKKIIKQLKGLFGK